MQNHNNKDERHNSLEKYTSHFIWKGSKGLLKVLLCETWVEQNCNILTPTLMAITVFLSCSPGQLNRGPGGPASQGHVPHSSIFSPTGLISNWLNFLCTKLYNCSTPTFFLWAPQIVLNSPSPRSRLYPDIPRPDAPVIYIGAFPILTARPGSICNTHGTRYVVWAMGKRGISRLCYQLTYLMGV